MCSISDDEIAKKIHELSARSCSSIDLYKNLLEYQEYLNTFDLNLNFARAATIIEGACKAYGYKVDNVEALGLALIHTLIGSKDHAHQGDGDDVETGQLKIPSRLARRRRIKDVLGEDEFTEIDNRRSVIGNDNINTITYLRHVEPDFNFFTKPGVQREGVLGILKKSDDSADSCLRDFVLNTELMLVPELFIIDVMNEESRIAANDYQTQLVVETDNCPDEQYNGPLTPSASVCSCGSYSDPSLRVPYCQRHDASFSDAVESEDVILSKLGVEDEPWNWSKHVNDWVDQTVGQLVEQELIPSKEIKVGQRTMKESDMKCSSKQVQKTQKGKKAISEFTNMEEYFRPHVRLSLKDPQHGVLPDVELYRQFEKEIKLVAALTRLRKTGTVEQNPAPDEDLLGFEAADDDVDDDVCRDAVDNAAEPFVDDTELPLPNPQVDSLLSMPDINFMQNQSPGRAVLNPDNMMPDRPKNGENGQPLVDIAQERFELSKEINVRVAAWHKSLNGEIALCEQRGALNMNIMAEDIMQKFTDHEPISFQSTFKESNRRDVARIFLTCLQLTNEGNIDIAKADDDGIMLRRLRAVRLREVDGYQPDVAGDSQMRSSSEANGNSELSLSSSESFNRPVKTSSTRNGEASKAKRKRMR